MKRNYKKLISKIALILIISLVACFFCACSVESVEEHDKRVAQEAAELESKAKETTDKTGKTTASNETTSVTGDTASADSDGPNSGGGDAQGQESEGNYNDENNSGYSDNSYTNNDSGSQSGGGQSSSGTDEKKVATVTINVKTRADGYLVKDAKVVVWEGDTVFDLMKQAQTNGVLTMDYVSSSGYDGAYITAINGIYYGKGTEAGWKYAITGNDKPLGVSSVKVKDGDVVTWYYVYSASETLY